MASGEDFVCDPPNVEDVAEVLCSVTDWYSVGLKLGVPTTELDDIRCTGGSKEKKKALARVWLEQGSDGRGEQGESPSWSRLHTVLSELNMVKAVDLINKRFRQGRNKAASLVPKLGNQPTLSQLHSIVGINQRRYDIIQECAGQWKVLADLLLERLSATITEEIERDASLPTLSDKCRAVFKCWLDGKPSTRQPITWKELLTVLGDLEKGMLVDDLMKFVFQQEKNLY